MWWTNIKAVIDYTNATYNDVMEMPAATFINIIHYHNWRVEKEKKEIEKFRQSRR